MARSDLKIETMKETTKVSMVSFRELWLHEPALNGATLFCVGLHLAVSAEGALQGQRHPQAIIAFAVFTHRHIA